MLKSYGEMWRKIKEGSYFLSKIKSDFLYADENDPGVKGKQMLLRKGGVANGRGGGRQGGRGYAEVLQNGHII